MAIRVLGLVHGEFSSHTVRILEIAKALRELGGYDVSFSGSGKNMRAVEREGFRVIETKTVPGREILDGIENELFPTIFHSGNIDELFLEEDALLRREKPDVILRDSFRELAGIAAKQYGIYDVFVQQANLSHYYHADFKPRNTPRMLRILPGERVITIPFTGFAPLVRIGELVFRRRISRHLHNKVRQLGLSLEKRCYEGVEADLILFPDSPLLFPFRNMKDRYKFIGPVLVKDSTEIPDWLGRFTSDTRKRVLTTSGSTGMQDRTESFIRAFRGGEFAVAVHNNSRDLPLGFYGGNFNVGAVLQHSDVFVTHGGIGSTYLGLVLGVPLISVYTHFEQQTNARQIEKLGAGVSLSCDDLSAKALKERVEIVLDRRYGERIREVSQILGEEARKSISLAVKYLSGGYECFTGGKCGWN
ncbi:MAG: hypothetical protein KKB21_01670 [Nanoarchaeota archaeon]|nr:hypothetical protein [Nanoarchaeota archaeon]MBU4086265.1 hypothetical protein [Nanoarchaeota archaeon]